MLGWARSQLPEAELQSEHRAKYWMLEVRHGETKLWADAAETDMLGNCNCDRLVLHFDVAPARFILVHSVATEHKKTIIAQLIFLVSNIPNKARHPNWWTISVFDNLSPTRKKIEPSICICTGKESKFQPCKVALEFRSLYVQSQSPTKTKKIYADRYHLGYAHIC